MGVFKNKDHTMNDYVRNKRWLTFRINYEKVVSASLGMFNVSKNMHVLQVRL